MAKNILLFFGIIALIIAQISFIGSFPGTFINVNISLILLVWLAITHDTVKMLWWALIMGVVMEFYTSFPYGILTIITVFTALALKLTYGNLFSNKSLYTYVFMTLIATVLYNVSLFLVSIGLFSANFVNSQILLPGQFINSLLWQAALNFIAAAGIFIIIHFLRIKFLKRFIVARR